MHNHKCFLALNLGRDTEEKRSWVLGGGTHVQHEFGVCVDEFDQSEQEALVASSVKFCGFLFEFKAVGHFPFEGQALLTRKTRITCITSTTS